ncbi:MAG: fumarylacetoacetate hydrolase family protein [Deltaproteobacteria bacterium]|nr:fumarylacetoacetate hydrolase family protein [Deltaproteobacteria bacterium]
MKIFRFLSESGEASLGIYDKDGQRQARTIQGNLFGDYRLTNEVAKVSRTLPLLTPCNIIALGLNYRKHADETGIGYPEIPVIFSKATSSVIGTGEPILLPLAGPDKVDYEGELAIVIGTKIKNATSQEALEAVLGYTCANDVSARDWQMEKQHNQWVRGKSFDTFCPLGPCLVTRDELPEPNNLRIRTVLNGSIMQDSFTADMIFDVPTLISSLSRSMTLLPGTVILTGTPEGVGFTRHPPVYLNKGDVITVEIEGIGSLTNPVGVEQKGTPETSR